jgi:hypothetical protein
MIIIEDSSLARVDADLKFSMMPLACAIALCTVDTVELGPGFGIPRGQNSNAITPLTLVFYEHSRLPCTGNTIVNRAAAPDVSLIAGITDPEH